MQSLKFPARFTVYISTMYEYEYVDRRQQQHATQMHSIVYIALKTITSSCQFRNKANEKKRKKIQQTFESVKRLETLEINTFHGIDIFFERKINRIFCVPFMYRNG